MKDAGHLDGPVEETLRLYVAMCAIEVRCGDLARMAAKLAFPDGTIPLQVIHTAIALMTTCGLYDGSGQFAVQVGIPAKSGVSGGIMAVTPGRAALATYGPALDNRGNSTAGVTMLAHLSERAGLSIFLPDTV
jgi:glutaminase